MKKEKKRKMLNHKVMCVSDAWVYKAIEYVCVCANVINGISKEVIYGFISDSLNKPQNIIIMENSEQLLAE